MRTLELIRAFSDREIEKIDELISQQKRKSLQLLYDLVKKYRKRTGLPTNEELYKKCFAKTYTSDKNYLLRNELRLLNEILYEYMTIETFKQYIKKHKSTYYLWLARSFFDNKLNGAFESDIDRFINYAKEYIKPMDTAVMYDLKSLWLISNQEKKVENLHQQLQIIDEWKDEEIRRLKYRLREMEARQSYIKSTLISRLPKGAMTRNDVITPKNNVIELNKQGYDWYEEYLIVKKECFEKQGPDRLKVLERKLAIEESDIYKSEFSVLDSKVSTLSSISIELILLLRYEDAHEIMHKAICLCEENKHPILPTLYQNYIANLINISSYQQAIDFYNKYEKQIVACRQAKTILIYKAYCHLFLNQADEAINSIPALTQLETHDHQMYRMVYLIAFTIRKQYELAINEGKNIARMLKADNEGHFSTDYVWINGLILKYINALIKEREPRRREITNLKHEMNNIGTHELNLMATREFSLRWLMRELEKH